MVRQFPSKGPWLSASRRYRRELKRITGAFGIVGFILNLNLVCELLASDKALQIVAGKIRDDGYPNRLNLSFVGKPSEYRSQQNPNSHTEQVQRRNPAMFLYETVHGELGCTNIGPFVELLAQVQWRSWSTFTS